MTMKTIKVAEATNTQLDWLVAKCESTTPPQHDTVAAWWFTIDGKDRTTSPRWAQAFNPTRRGDHMVPIIERAESYTLKKWAEARPDLAYQCHIWDGVVDYQGFGPTSLIAAARCYVASKLGETVEVPEELT